MLSTLILLISSPLYSSENDHTSEFNFTLCESLFSLENWSESIYNFLYDSNLSSTEAHKRLNIIKQKLTKEGLKNEEILQFLKKLKSFKNKSINESPKFQRSHDHKVADENFFKFDLVEGNHVFKFFDSGQYLVIFSGKSLYYRGEIIICKLSNSEIQCNSTLSSLYKLNMQISNNVIQFTKIIENESTKFYQQIIGRKYSHKVLKEFLNFEDAFLKNDFSFSSATTDHKFYTENAIERGVLNTITNRYKVNSDERFMYTLENRSGNAFLVKTDASKFKQTLLPLNFGFFNSQVTNLKWSQKQMMLAASDRSGSVFLLPFIEQDFSSNYIISKYRKMVRMFKFSKRNSSNYLLPYTHKSEVSLLSWSEDETKLATTSNDGQVYITEVKGRNVLRSTEIPTRVFLSVTMLKWFDNKLYIGYSNGFVKVINGDSFLEEGSFPTVPFPIDLMIHKDSNYYVVVSEQGSHRTLNFLSEDHLNKFNAWR